MLGDYSYVTHVESLIEVLKSGNNVFAMPIERGVDIDEHTDLDHVVTVHDALVAALPDVDVRIAEAAASPATTGRASPPRSRRPRSATSRCS